MTVVDKHEPGTFCWADVLLNDTEVGKKFYSDLFGWDVNDMPTPQGPVYTMFLRDGKTICALAPMPQGQEMPPHWNAYISVEDVDATAAKAVELGGVVVMPAMDVMTAGRMVFIQDPSGAIAGYWQPKDHIGAELIGETGTVGWNELLTRDVEAAKNFYTALLGWTANTQDMGGGVEYTTFMDGEAYRGGLMQMPEMVPEMVPANWTVYFLTDDADALAARVKELGGVVQVEPQDIPDVGRFTVVADPQGAVFAAIKMAESPS